MASLMNMVRRVPGYRSLQRTLDRRFNVVHTNPFLKAARPGHYYSPIPDMADVEARGGQLFDQSRRQVPGVDLREADQLRWLETCRDSLAEAPSQWRRFKLNNGFFSDGDACIAAAMVRHVGPARLIEVGSGFSSAAMLDASEAWLGGTSRFTFIEPYPERLMRVLGDQASAHEVIVDQAQNVPLSRFQALRANDVLFIDSSHVAKIGSDVNYLFGEVLPVLASGVIVHVHDIFWPFEYQQRFVREGWAWNEAYVLRAFLQFNARFEIVYFADFIAQCHAERVQPAMRDVSSLWLRVRP
jgi:hypothetical protein